MSLLLALALSSLSTGEIIDPRPADLDLSAVRFIDCKDWTGTGFLVADGILVTALHVGNGEDCRDGQTGEPLSLYKKDEANDLAFMTGNLPTNIPYIKMSCEPYKKNEKYFAYGITGYGVSRPILRMNSLTYTGRYTDKDFYIRGMHGEATTSPGMALFDGFVAPGMSGGPVVDSLGYAHSLVNASNNKRFESYEFSRSILCQNSSR